MAEVTIGGLADAGVLAFGDGYRTKREEHGTPGYRILRVADVLDGQVVLDGPDFVSTRYARSIGPKLSEPGDVLLTTKGTVGRVAIFPDTPEQVVYSPQLCYFRVIDRAVVDARFLSYWFKSEAFARQASHRANNTDMAAYINLRDIASLRIDLPEIALQRAIAEVLGAIDDKIAMNSESIATIDDLLALRFAKLSAGRPWVTLKSLAVLNQRLVKPQSGGRLRYLDISSVGRGRYDYPVESDWDDAPGRARRKVSRGDVVWSTVRPNRRSCALVLDTDSNMVGSTGLAVLTPRHGLTAVLYEAVRTERFVAFLESVAEGSAYPAVRADRLLDAPVPDLAPEILETFELAAMPMRELGHAMTVESRCLNATRNELLPLLLSGQIHVRSAAREVEEMV